MAVGWWHMRTWQNVICVSKSDQEAQPCSICCNHMAWKAHTASHPYISALAMRSTRWAPMKALIAIFFSIHHFDVFTHKQWDREGLIDEGLATGSVGITGSGSNTDDRSMRVASDNYTRHMLNIDTSIVSHGVPNFGVLN